MRKLAIVLIPAPIPERPQKLDDDASNEAPHFWQS
jgi:hypothetical protein